MATLQLRRLFRTPIQKLLVRSVANGVTQPNTQKPHIYKKKYTTEELFTYLSDNVVYTCEDYIVSSVPQGIKAFSYDDWTDSDSDLVCDACLHDVIPDLCTLFNCRTIFICKCPRRNASGLLVMSNKRFIYNHFKNFLVTAARNFEKIHTYLAVVIGSPVEVMSKTFTVQPVFDNGTGYTRISDYSSTFVIAKRAKYDHLVIDSVGDFSLVKIRVSYDARDAVRHILAQSCFTPVFGDSWNVKRSVNFLFGAPIASDRSCMKPTPYGLSPPILEKLQLTPGDEKYIPIHCHLYGLKWSVKRKKDFFVSVPPPESFTWTCRQLGLYEIEQFAKRDQQSSPL